MRLKPVLNSVAFFVMIGMNGLANSLPLNGKTTGEVSASVPVLFTPASYVFSIWGVIYLWLLAFVVYHLLPVHRHALFVKRIGYWFLLSCVANSVWLVCWHYEQFGLTMLVMLGLLACLIMIYRRLDVGRRRVSRWDHLLVHVPFSIYLGWVSVATLANFSIVLTVLNLDSLGLPPPIFTILLLLIAAGLGIGMILRRREIAYPLVIAWALVGIAVRHQETLPVIAIPAAILACVVVSTLLLAKLKRSPELLDGIKTS
ncbi:tryptophan-rich sensory protein [candidate division KSB3 bacterium]|uniref:Tryptophan-rich sensory protein n=1 Tax=candidate division KSB3 bacterium TaxID=2044937 RepID=A0A9D5JSL0_9BACT|nr:tryptophan-rich sensory protein [candidate division KSB3 bacterium]MBD3323269.1 tryptophan-rich sensory protein [candidate division KSB3 bacterium]